MHAELSIQNVEDIGGNLVAASQDAQVLPVWEGTTNIVRSVEALLVLQSHMYTRMNTFMLMYKKNALASFQMSLDVLRVLAKTKGRHIPAFSRLQPPCRTTRKHDLNADRCWAQRVYIAWSRDSGAM